MNKDKKTEKPLAANAAEEVEDAAARVGPYNPELGDIYQRLYPEIMRPKPNQEAIAAALHAMQRLTMKMDSETAAEDTAAHAASDAFKACSSCGHRNREGNRFCAMCGSSMEGAGAGAAKMPASGVERGEALEAEPSTQLASLPEDSLSQQRLPADHQEASKSNPAEHQTLAESQSVVDAGSEMHPQAGSATGSHHYHHHYHHHYFPGGGMEAPLASPRVGNSESVREVDRLRLAAAAKGEPISRSEAAVRRLTQEWVMACNMRQLDELLELYAPDALVVRSNLPLLRGAAQVREFFFSALEAGLGEVSLEPVRVEVLGDLAHEVGRYSALVPGNTGKRREERGKYLWVFARQNGANQGGEWKLISECWSSDLTLTNTESDLPRAMTPSGAKPANRKG